jgi:hypothetical protein
VIKRGEKSYGGGGIHNGGEGNKTIDHSMGTNQTHEFVNDMKQGGSNILVNYQLNVLRLQ